MLPAVRLLVITRQFRTPHWFPCEMTSEKPQQTTSEIPYCWRQWLVTTKIWVVLLIGWNKFLSRHDQSEELPRSVTRHQYGIAALVFQTSFRGETSGGVLKCRLFSHATQRHVVSWALGKKISSSFLPELWSCDLLLSLNLVQCQYCSSSSRPFSQVISPDDVILRCLFDFAGQEGDELTIQANQVSTFFLQEEWSSFPVKPCNSICSRLHTFSYEAKTSWRIVLGNFLATFGVWSNFLRF